MEYLSIAWNTLRENSLVIPGAIILASLIIGYIFQKFIVIYLRKWSEKTIWKGDDIIVNAIDSIPALWFLLGGVYIALWDAEIPEATLDIANQVIIIIAIASTAFVLARMVDGFVSEYAKKTGSPFGSTSMINILVKVVIYVLGGLVILQTLGISITPLLTALGVGGLAVALALQETLSNLFAGIQLIAAKKYHPGDFIELDDGKMGYIEDISWRNTTIRTLPNNLVVIPNNKIASATITNYAKPANEMAVLIDVGVAYSSDLKKVEQVTVEVGKEIQKNVEGAVKEFEPFIRYNNFGESSIGFTVILRAEEFVAQYLIKHEFVKALQARYHQEGIEIPFPQRVIHNPQK